jgi:hypothetical protein
MNKYRNATLCIGADIFRLHYDEGRVVDIYLIPLEILIF